jgi:hypothetical protein
MTPVGTRSLRLLAALLSLSFAGNEAAVQAFSVVAVFRSCRPTAAAATAAAAAYLGLALQHTGAGRHVVVHQLPIFQNHRLMLCEEVLAWRFFA